MPESLDLAALREKAERLAAIEACEWSFGDNETELMVDMTPQFRDECVEAMLAVLSLVDDLRAALDAKDGGPAYHAGRLVAALKEVDDLRAENERMRKGLTRLRDYGALTDEFVRVTADTILAGSPAEDRALLALGGDDEEASP